MRLVTLLLASFLTLSQVGCQSTRVIEVGQERYGELESLTELASRQPASVVLRSGPQTVANVKWMRLSDDTLHYRYGDGLTASAPLTELDRIVFGRRVALLWPAAGGVVGGIAVGLATLSSKDRGGDALTPDGFTFAAGFGGGFLIGALVGGIVGGVASRPGVIYRFRPDTPEEISVVIGVGPSMNQSGGGR